MNVEKLAKRIEELIGRPVSIDERRSEPSGDPWIGPSSDVRIRLRGVRADGGELEVTIEYIEDYLSGQPSMGTARVAGWRPDERALFERWMSDDLPGVRIELD